MPLQPSPSNVADVVRRLLAEPLTHLMLGHRELFHSNLLAWFFENLPDAADAVFLPLTTANPATSVRRRVLRESGNLDLQFEWPGQDPLIIENKVFSLPDEGQLARYTEDMKAGSTPSLWLLSSSDPGWPDNQKVIGGRVWKWLSYAVLADRIQAAVRGLGTEYPVETMRHYAIVAALLSDLAKSVVPQDSRETVSLAPAVREAVGASRLLSVVSKFRADGISQWMRRCLTREGFSSGEFEGTITHSQAVNSWYADVLPGSIRAGWQIQGGTFRLAMIMEHLTGRDDAARTKRFEFAFTHQGFFEFGDLDGILGTAGSPVAPKISPKNPMGFLRFDPDFVYRYKSVPHLSLAQLERASVVVAQRVRTMAAALGDGKGAA